MPRVGGVLEGETPAMALVMGILGEDGPDDGVVSHVGGLERVPSGPTPVSLGWLPAIAEESESEGGQAVLLGCLSQPSC